MQQHQQAQYLRSGAEGAGRKTIAIKGVMDRTRDSRSRTNMAAQEGSNSLKDSFEKPEFVERQKMKSINAKARPQNLPLGDCHDGASREKAESPNIDQIVADHLNTDYSKTHMDDGLKSVHSNTVDGKSQSHVPSVSDTNCFMDRNQYHGTAGSRSRSRPGGAQSSTLGAEPSFVHEASFVMQYAPVTPVRGKEQVGRLGRSGDTSSPSRPD